MTPPGPALTSYMETQLSEDMRPFQRQMSLEIQRGGVGVQQGEEVEDTGVEIKIISPEMSTFWEMSRFHPSSENQNLVVLIVQAVVVCRQCSACAIVSMNIYVDGEVSSGFTLDDVMLIDTKLVPQEMKDKALQRHQARQEASLTNMSFGEAPPALRPPTANTEKDS